MKPPILSLCDFTGNALRPWADAGFDCMAVDLQHPPGLTFEGRISRLGCDIRHFKIGDRPAFVMAFPPCTHLAVTGARWFKGKGLRALAEGIELVAVCAEICEAAGCPYLIENPVSTLSTYWRDPDYTFHPSEYAGYLEDPSPEAYHKRTCLWVGGGFLMPPRRPVDAIHGSKMHNVSSGPDQANIRSATPKGFARAVFEANHGRVTCGSSPTVA